MHMCILVFTLVFGVILQSGKKVSVEKILGF